MSEEYLQSDGPTWPQTENVTVMEVTERPVGGGACCVGGGGGGDLLRGWRSLIAEHDVEGASVVVGQ